MKLKIPGQVRADLDKAQRLAWWTLFWMSTVVVAMWFAMGSSQAMKTALIEDLLSLIPRGGLPDCASLRAQARQPRVPVRL